MTGEVMERLNAALSGRYRLERQLGQGGMATVYLAEDLKHDRRVAVKVLKPELAAVVGGARFISEIRTTANLQHPHILPLFDSGEADSFLFYVMPYVEGETLGEKLDREKQLSVAEAVAITVKIAGALQSAHDQGIIHRDIKPANVLLQNGEPVVADFGIALALRQAGDGRITETGLSLGTPYYMAPEQATGDRDPDARSDLYSLACMLYEMLTGEPPFQGTTAQAVLGRILTEPPPDVTRTRPSVPPHIGAILTRALQKLPADRFESVAEFSRALQNEGYVDPSMRASGAWAAAQAGGGPTWKRLLPWGVTGVSVLAVVGLLLRPAPAPPTAIATRSEVRAPGGSGVGGVQLAISPDGGLIVAVGENEGGQGSRLFARSAGSVEWRPIPNTEGARGPSVSPDAAWVVFDRQGGGLFKVPIEGGSALPVAESGRASHWGLDGTIVFVTDNNSLYRVPGSGGEPELLLDGSRVDPGISFPHILPDGSAVLFSTPTSGDALNGSIFLYDLASDEVRPVVPSGNRPVYLPTGHVVYGHGSQTLMAVTLDLATGEVGSPTTVISELGVFNGGAAQFAVAYETGTLVYADHDPRGRDSRGSTSLVEIGFDGIERSLDLSPGSLAGPRYSPDGARIAYQEDLGIRVYDVTTGASPLLVEDGLYPVWSPRGDDLYYTSTTRRGNALGDGRSGMRRRPDPGQSEEQLYSGAEERYVRAVLVGSGGDSILILRENHPDRGRDLLLMRLGPAGAVPEDASPSPFLTAEWDEWQAEISPAGRHVAYVSNQEGVERVYLQSFPTPGERQVVSPLGGTDPRWAPDGQSIFYRVGTTFFEVDLRFDPSVSVGDRREVLDVPRYRGGGFRVDPNYDIHPDGDRFVLAVCMDGCEDGAGVEGDGDFYIVTNWFTELLQLTGEAIR